MITYPKKTIDSIQALRGFAALLVVFFHYGITLKLDPGSPLAIIFSHGWSGVDLFFIISGFIAAHTVENQSSGFCAGMEYLIKRVSRIVPLYYLVTIFSAGHSMESFIETGKSLLFIPLGGLPPDSLGPGYGGARVGQGWTLNYEMYFYLIVSISFLFGKMKWPFTAGFMAITLLAPIIIYGAPDSYGFSGFNFEWFYLGLMTNPITLEFIIGILVYYVFSKMDSDLSIGWLILIPTLILTYAINLYSPFYFNSRITAWAIPSALLMIAMLKLGATGKIKINSLIMHVGNISFSIYLLHEAAQGILRKVIKLISGNEHIFSNISMRVLLFVISLTLTFYLSGLSYKYVEHKLSIKLRSFLLSKIALRKKQPV
ncbi:acyltransferase family protein [Erwinia pyrifoliae]|uniref:Acyltransferase n=1 Tax=Erwinia pyrifoliae TaxID=79967 RepID=A0ABY5XCE4_ERWPY|nr:acyltransferase [Erwinia pyrifoliae]UWS35095.1 acyltransferase [Erwinia pyrifoliae]